MNTNSPTSLLGSSRNRLFTSLLLLAGILGFCATVHAADRASIRGILVVASNEKGGSDGRLAQYEPTLKRILRFESYRQVGEGSVSLNVPGEGSLSLGEGHSLELETEGSDGKSVRVKVRWVDGGRTLMNTGLSLRSGVPAVLGGPSRGNGEVYAVIVVGR